MAKREFAILVVDEDKGNQEEIRNALINEGRTLRVAYSSEEAVEIASKYSVDMIILDLNTARKRGGDLIQSILKKENGPKIPFVVMSENNDLATKLRCFVSGAARFFSKPVDMNELQYSIFKAEAKNMKEPI
jgi:two-component system, NtrC family, nitrogen regulation response regulator NtrX